MYFPTHVVTGAGAAYVFLLYAIQLVWTVVAAGFFLVVDRTALSQLSQTPRPRERPPARSARRARSRRSAALGAPRKRADARRLRENLAQPWPVTYLEPSWAPRGLGSRRVPRALLGVAFVPRRLSTTPSAKSAYDSALRLRPHVERGHAPRARRPRTRRSPRRTKANGYLLFDYSPPRAARSPSPGSMEFIRAKDGAVRVVVQIAADARLPRAGARRSPRSESSATSTATRRRRRRRRPRPKDAGAGRRADQPVARRARGDSASRSGRPAAGSSPGSLPRGGEARRGRLADARPRGRRRRRSSGSRSGRREALVVSRRHRAAAIADRAPVAALEAALVRLPLSLTTHSSTLPVMS